MITFDSIEISKDERELTIIASIENSGSVSFSSLIIDNQETYSVSGPSSNPLYTTPLSGKSINIKVTTKDLKTSFDRNMFFVYLTLTGIGPSEESMAMKTVIDLYPIYKDIMAKIREVECECGIPKLLIDRFLQIEAIDICIKTGAYVKAIEYWNKFFKDRKIW